MAEAPKVAELLAPAIARVICSIVDYAKQPDRSQESLRIAEQDVSEAVRAAIKIVDSVKA